MNIKIGFLTGAILLTALVVGGISAVAATNEISRNLQQGLFEEEANHNYPAAIKAYESVVSQVDSNRALAATAIFRLGEIYRRQGKTNEASAQYERILREFHDQEELTKLSRANLPNSPGVASTAAESASLELRALENQISALKKLTSADQRVLVQQQFPNPVLNSLMQQLNESEQRLTELNKQFGSEHPEVMQQKARHEIINRQLRDQVESVIRGLELRRDALAAAEPHSQLPDSRR